MKSGCETLIKLFLVVSLSPGIFGFGKTVYIGGLFEEGTLVHKAFRSSVISLNEERRKNEDLPNQIIQPHFVETTYNDSYDVSRTVCNLANSGVAALFGPHNEITSRLVQGMCNTMRIPRVTARWDNEQLQGNGLINMFPNADALSTVFLKLAMDYKWESLTIIYEKTKNLAQMNKLFKTWDPTVTVWQLTGGPNYRKILRDVRRSGVLNIVLDCSNHILPEVLKQAHQVGLMTDRHSFIIASLDLQTIDLEPYQYGETNITGLRLVDPNNPLVREAFETENYDWDLKDPSQLTVEAALVYDGVQLFGRALKKLDETFHADVGTLLCSNHESWAFGPTLLNIMRTIEFQGLTGRIKFDANGYRSHFKLDLIGLDFDGVKKIGVWDSLSRPKQIPKARPENPVPPSLRNETFIVHIVLLKPYAMLKENAANETGNDRYEGYCIDIIHELSKNLGFKYTFIVSGNDFGTKDPITKEWHGPIREIMDGRADLAIGDLTITAERQEVVDFTMPFMKLGIGILFTKPLPTGSSLFAFLSPFSTDLWLGLLGAYTFCSLLTFIMGRFCAAEWNNPNPCIKEPKVLQNNYASLITVFYSNLKSIVQQGPEIRPKGISMRMVAAFWWFFCLIMTVSYTASLARCLLRESKNVLIENVDDLANNQHGIKYGAKMGGSTVDFFNAYTNPTYRKMSKYMQKNADEVLLATTTDGIQKVLQGNYAFLMESSTIAYEVQRNCELDQVGPLLDHKGYGIAMKKDSKYRVALSTAVSKLQATEVLTKLYDRWWIHRWTGEICGKEKKTAPLGSHNVGGVFVILAAGVALASVLAAWELIRKVWGWSTEKKVPFKQEMAKELRFVVNLNANKKPARRSENGCASNDPNDQTPQFSSSNVELRAENPQNGG